MFEVSFYDGRIFLSGKPKNRSVNDHSPNTEYNVQVDMFKMMDYNFYLGWKLFVFN